MRGASRGWLLEDLEDFAREYRLRVARTADETS